MIELKNVGFRYAPEGFSLSVPELRVEPGERVAAIGPSGSGKTTLLNLVSGIEVPSAGEVHTAGVRVDGLSAAARRAFRITRVGFVFQGFLLLDYLDVLQNILYPYRLHSDLRLNGEVRKHAAQLAERLGIADLLDRRPDALSHGERQRVAIARALITSPPLVLADEPTGNLDPESRDQALDLLFAQCEALGATLLTVTHDHGVLDRFDRVIDVANWGAKR